jgi:hypothetical protein
MTSDRVGEAVANSFPELLARTPSMLSKLDGGTLDEIAVASLAARFGDYALARDWHSTLMSQFSEHVNRRHDHRCRIKLVPVAGHEPSEVRTYFFDAYVDLRYNTTLTQSVFQFGVVPDVTEYEREIEHGGWEFLAIAEPTIELPVLDERVFHLERLRINGASLDIESRLADDRVSYIARGDALDELVGSDVVIDYEYRLKVQKRSHVYVQYVEVPTRNVSIEFDVGQTDIQFVNVFDFFVGRDSPLITPPESAKLTRSVQIELNEWVFPKSGVLFGWVSADEMSR